MMQSQRGNTLLVSLLLLLILTIVAVGSIGGVSLSQKMASNYQDRQVAFQTAEAVLAEGERAAQFVSQGFNEADFAAGCGSGGDCFTDVCNGGKCFNGTYSSGSACVLDNSSEPHKDPTTWSSNARSVASNQNFPELTNKPRYIIEFLCYVVADPAAAATPAVPPPYGADWAYMYRISSFVEGANGGARVMLQSTFKVLQ